MLNLNELTIV